MRDFLMSQFSQFDCGSSFWLQLSEPCCAENRRSLQSWRLHCKPRRLCTIQLVENHKTLVRVFPLWSSNIFVSTPIVIQSTLTILQVLTMDRHLGNSHFKIPAGFMLVLVLISTCISLPLIDHFLSPICHKLIHQSPTPLQRLGLDHGLNIISMHGRFSVSGVEASQKSKLLKIPWYPCQPCGYAHSWFWLVLEKHGNCSGCSDSRHCFLLGHSFDWSCSKSYRMVTGWYKSRELG